MFNDKQIKKITVKNALLIITYTVLLITAMLNIQKLLHYTGIVFEMIKPFLYGFCIAYVFNLPMKFFIKKLPDTVKHKRICAGVLSFLLMVVLLVCIFNVIVPTIMDNISLLIESMPLYVDAAESFINENVNKFNLDKQVIDQFIQFASQFEEAIIQFLKGMVPALVDTAKSVVGAVSTLVLAIVFAVYFTVSKDTLLAQFKRVAFAFLPIKVNDYLLHVGAVANTTFSSFISGQLSESVIIGVLCYIGCLILRIPYAPIVSLLVGLTNIIPYFGPIISTMVCGFLILFVNPAKAIVFVIFGICLQQFESNLIYPKVVGTSVGLSGLWVLFAVSIGGGLFGISGLILGLPTFAVLYTLLREETHRRIKKKEELIKPVVKSEEE